MTSSQMVLFGLISVVSFAYFSQPNFKGRNKLSKAVTLQSTSTNKFSMNMKDNASDETYHE
jgi:hypothetical protein